MKNLWLLFFIHSCFAGELFDQVVIWGHKLHTHTHSYIHERFYRAFQHLGYPTYWFDNQDHLEGFDFSRTLFLTEGQVDQQMPLRTDCLYVLHNCPRDRYKSLFQMGRCINLQVYSDDVLARTHLLKVEPFIYYDIEGRVVYMPWASDLLPHEIEETKRRLPTLQKRKIFHWMGTFAEGAFGNANQLNPFIQACKENGIEFSHNDPWANGLSRQVMMERTEESFLAPAIVGKWQEEHGYIPCRIFINISAGQFGLTNSLRVYELFDQKIVYNPDTYQLFYDALERLKTWSWEDQYALMDIVKNKHTYLNRIATLLNFLELLDAKGH
ncbi:MAG: hypothetical protein KGJ02_05475 [Verrucomicrobiota bacterium]|nr:hypothetical protein [Verrucomicrobiota bacterium]